MKRIDTKEIGETEMKFFEMNPQLQRIEIFHHTSIDKLGFVSKKLPNLEYIAVKIYIPHNTISDQMKNQIIHLKSVKKCRLTIVSISMSEVSVIPLVFDQLEELETNTWYTLDVWSEFIKRHDKLKEMRVAHIDGQGLKMIVEKMPNLMRLHINRLENVQDEAVKSLMSSATNLETITMATSETTNNLFRNLLKSTWDINCRCFDGFCETILNRI